MPKKKFINKKNAVSFKLIPRSQQDPLVANEDAPQIILQPIDIPNNNKKETPEERERRIEEQHKYGIFFDDDTNYLEFIKDRSDNQMVWPEHVEKEIQERRVRFALPKEVFASEKEETVGMLNKPSSDPQLELDPDILAALDGTEETEELEDNFIELAEGVVSDEEMDVEYEDYSEHDSDDFNESDGADVVSSDDDEFSDDEINSTQPTSCLAKHLRTNQPYKNFEQEKLDKQMEKMLKIFDDIQSAANDMEDRQEVTPMSNEDILKYEEDLLKNQQRFHVDRDEATIAVIKEMAKRKNAFKTEYEEYEVVQKPTYDSQSVFTSVPRNLHILKVPTKPKKIKVNERTGLPENILGQNKLTKSMLDKHNQLEDDMLGRGSRSVYSTTSRLTELSIRDKDETPEERRERKKALKEYRKERRFEKKCNKRMFATESQAIKARMACK